MTNTAEAKKLTDSFLSFFEQASQVIDIKIEKDYGYALELIEHLMAIAEDRKGEPLLYMIGMVADSIEKYEDSFEDIMAFNREVDELDPAISTLRIIIDQNNLTYSDLKEEIGSKSLVSQIVNGKRNLTRDHIAKLSARFHVSPELFF